jgi:predicted aldo/keto reductase-like oxidoreductase
MERMAELAPGLPRVCRLGLATRGNAHLRPEDVEWAVSRGINYLNWCGHPDGMSQAIARMGAARRGIVVAAQFEARTATDAAREFRGILDELRTDTIDVLTLYYVESPGEWEQIRAPGGALEFLAEQKRLGRLKMIGLTSHQRELAARWAREGLLDMLMVRYNAAHRGAERDVFPVAREQGIPVVTFTGLRWKALLEPAPGAPEGFRAPASGECYRFCLAEPRVTVTLTAPGNRAELEENLKLLDDWHPPQPAEHEAMRQHGDRVRRHAGTFW